MKTCPGAFSDGKCKPCSLSYEYSPEAPVWDGKKCVPCPKDRPNWDYERRECMPPCPEEKPIWMAGELWDGYAVCASCAVATADNEPFWDPVGQKCVKSCAAGSEPAGDSSVCRTCAQADARYPFWDPDAEECVAKCPELSVGSVCRHAEEVEPDKPYFDPASNTPKSCSAAFPGNEFWEPNARKCVKQCPDWVSADNAKICRKCADGEFWNGEKCASCPSWLPNWDSEKKKCVSACSDDAPVFLDGTCVSCAQYSVTEGENVKFWLPNASCVEICPESAPLADAQGVCRTCVEKNPEKPLWDGTECISCGSKEFFDGVECAAECPPEIPFADKYGICWACAQVDALTPYWESGSCKACSEPTPYWSADEKKCVKDCQTGQQASLEAKVCVAACGKFQVVDDRKCVCAPGLKFDAGRKECVLDEDETWGDHVDTCVAAGMVIGLDGTSCVEGCSQNEKEADGRCVCRENSALAQTGDGCVLRRECENVRVVDGAETCVTSGECGAQYQRADGACVSGDKCV